MRILLTLINLVPFVLYGQSMTSDTLSNVVVSASRQQISLTKTPYAVEILSVEQILTKTSRATPDLLTNTAGIFLQKTNHGGGSAFVRGLTGNQTLLVLDGIRFNNSIFRYGPNQYLNTIDPFILSKVEVLKGSGAVQYGSDALTGVVHFSTLNPDFSDKKRFSGMAVGRLATANMEQSVQSRFIYQSSQTSVALSGSFKHFGDIIRGGGLGVQTPTGYDEWNYFAKIRQKINAHWLAEGLIQTTQQTNVPVFHKVVLENFKQNEMDLQRFQRAYLKTIGTFSKGFIRQVSFSLTSQQSFENRKIQKNGSMTLRAESDEVQTVGALADIQMSFTKRWSAHSGFDYYQDHVLSSRKDINNGNSKNLRGLYPDKSQYAYRSLYHLNHLDLAKWQIEFGIRYHLTQASLPDTTVGISKIDAGALVYTAGIVREITPTFFVYANTSTGFRAPNLDDLGSLGIVDFRYELPAFDLKPEYSQNYDIGFKWNRPSFSQNFSLFRTNLQNLITRVKTSKSIQNYIVYEKKNVDDAFLTGVEWSGNFLISSTWQVGAQASFVYGQNVTMNEPMRRIPPFNGGLTVTYHFKKGLVQLENLFAAEQTRLSVGDKSDNRMNPKGTAGWSIVNLRSSWDIFSNISFQIKIENLGDVDYRMHGSGINGIGRSVWGQLQCRF